MSLKDKAVLITGATGFVGSHLAQHLAQEHGARVTGTGRNLDAVSFLRGSGVMLQRADLLDLRRLRSLADGQRIVFHLAAWMGQRHGEREKAWALNVYVTRKLVEMAAEAGAERFVFVSSIAAYGLPVKGVIQENQPLALQENSLYGRSKAQAELQARQMAREAGLPLTIVRPGMIFGPRSFGWTLRVIRLIQRGVPVIFGNGDGHAHPVYIDNLIQALVLAATANRAKGEAFHIVDQALSWRDWFERYGQMCGRQPRRLPLWLARIALTLVRYLPLGMAIDRDLLAYYTAQTVYSTAKAEAYLDYRPAVDLDEAMRRTAEWLRREGYV